MAIYYVVDQDDFKPDTPYGFLRGADDADIDALWERFRRQFKVSGPFPHFDGRPRTNDPRAAFVQWLLQEHGFQRVEVRTFVPTFETLTTARHGPH